MPSIFDSLIQQESGGRTGVRGPVTKYGQPLGRTQMLPATAEEMARKVGVPFDISMLTDKSPQGAAYQDRLGQAYYNEGLQRTGNERDALRYYHGGPNRKLWGPKTNAYADSILARHKGTPMIKPRKPQEKPAAMPQAMQPPMPTEPFGFEGAQIDPASLGPTAALDAEPAKLKKGGIFGSGLNGFDLMGLVADSYLQATDQKTPYSDQRREKREMQFDRDKFNQELEARRQMALDRASLPKAPTQTDRYIEEILNPATDPTRKAILRQIIQRPINVPTYGADGSVKNEFYYPDQMPGLNGASDDEWEYN